jgi:hypothetical protein
VPTLTRAECLDDFSQRAKKTCVVLPYDLSLGHSLDLALRRNQDTAQSACHGQTAFLQKGIEVKVIDDPAKWSIEVRETFICGPWF